MMTSGQASGPWAQRLDASFPQDDSSIPTRVVSAPPQEWALASFPKPRCTARVLNKMSGQIRWEMGEDQLRLLQLCPSEEPWWLHLRCRGIADVKIRTGREAFTKR